MYWNAEIIPPSVRYYGFVESASNRNDFDPEDLEILYDRGIPQIVDSGEPDTLWPLTLRQDEVASLPPGLVSLRGR